MTRKHARKGGRPPIGDKPQRRPRAPVSPVAREMIAELRARRIALGWSQDELAGRAGVNATGLARVELFSTGPGFDYVLRVAHALGMRLQLLPRCGYPSTAFLRARWDDETEPGVIKPTREER